MSSKQHYDTLLAIVEEQEDIRRFVNCEDDGIYITEEMLNAIIWAVNHPLDLLLFKGYEFSLKLPSEFLEVEDE